MTREAFLVGLVREIQKLPSETPWVELKENNTDPQAMGEYISALANAAALEGKSNAYVVWGMSDADHALVGTAFEPAHAKGRGNEDLEAWLLRSLAPRIDFRFDAVVVDGHRVVLLEIARASGRPVAFCGIEFIRVGSYKKKLKDYPEKERKLWRLFDQTPFEEAVALEHVQGSDVLELLDYPAYFQLAQVPLPEGRGPILDALRREALIKVSNAGGYDITNLGAVLFARRLDDFARLKRKAIRVVQYKGSGRFETTREQVGAKGYANGFEGLIRYINGLLPSNEVIGQALRKEVPMFPPLAVRELVANALIHQDFSIRGAGPMVEVFDHRLEVTNPGKPLVETQRFLDTPPKSRNEALASLMRRLGICEERGSGIDKVVHEIELYQLPAPLFEVPDGSTRVTLFAHQTLGEMDKEDRARACYLHACLKYVQRDYLTNSSLRERFGIEDQNRAMASRLIKDATKAGLIVAHDPKAGPKYMKYVPFWAKVIQQEPA